ncbi:hypothetical protein B0T26DRAFT_756723 [Lasiosphaeria miniovina]|uniref:Uncharacterized protein n=1 Tax=Lasiosphaeria miniovina TaxID=1954250 RepID=A0AA40DHD0_9PEZI|nr:uncharacterized protein B0T26DRAFT_756723 [Lasiosphaeria miniovina]KAK0703160.1 hypothetical protein B0T26DRAFT_756723 [Lasiosphaeria miniovina]
MVMGRHSHSARGVDTPSSDAWRTVTPRAPPTHCEWTSFGPASHYEEASAAETITSTSEKSGATPDTSEKEDAPDTSEKADAPDKSKNLEATPTPDTSEKADAPAPSLHAASAEAGQPSPTNGDTDGHDNTTSGTSLEITVTLYTSEKSEATPDTTDEEGGGDATTPDTGEDERDTPHPPQ